MRVRIGSRVWVLLWVWVLAIAPARAATTGSLEIEVRGSDGLRMSDAAVVLGGDLMIGGALVKDTGPEGSVRFDNLLPGDGYHVEVVHAEGEALVGGLTVVINRVERHVVRLNQLTVEVTRVRPIEGGTAENKDVLDRELLDRLPAPRTVEGAIELSRGATVGPTARANPNLMGGNTDENAILLDGMQITDPVTGTFSANFNYDAIEQLEVLLGGYMPENGQAIGGIVNIVTQSGSNVLEFDTSVYYTDGDWRPRLDERVTADGVEIAPSGFENTFRTFQVATRVSGPIVRDKAFFMLSYQHSRSRIGIAGTPQPRDFDGHYLYGKLTWQGGAAHRFTATLQLDPTTIDNTTQGNPFVRGEAQGRQSQGGLLTGARWLWTLGPRTEIESYASFQRSFIQRSGTPCRHDAEGLEHKCRVDEASGAIDWETPARQGVSGAFSSGSPGFFDFDDRDRVIAGTKLAVRAVEDPLGGKHDLKFGVEASQLVWDKTFGVNGNLLYLDWNRVPFDPDSFENLLWYEYSRPFEFRTTSSQQSFFAQDAWEPVDNLNINYGFRYDRSSLRNDVGETVLALGAIAPRLYAAWDPWGDGRTKVASGWGRFTDTGRLGVADFTSRSGFGTKLFLGEFYGQQAGTGFLNAQELNVETAPNDSLRTAHDTLRNPATDEVLLLLERQVAPSVAISSRMTGRFTRNLYEFDDTATIYDADGTTDLGTRIGRPDLPLFRLRTPTIAQRTMFRWDLEVRKVLSRRWSAQVTYSFTQLVGTSSASLSGAFANGPQLQYARGPLPNAQDHVLRALAVWDLPFDPWTPQLGVFFVAGSGIPVERLAWSSAGTGSFSVRNTRRGGYTELDPFWDLSVRLQQTIDVRKGAFRVLFEARNLTNNRAGGRLDSAVLTGGSALERTGRAVRVERQDPLRLQVGAQYEF